MGQPSTLTHASPRRLAKGVWCALLAGAGVALFFALAPASKSGRQELVALREALQAKDGRIREQAAEALGAIGASAQAVLCEALLDPDHEIRAAAARALGQGEGGASAVAPLRAALQDREPFVRLRAAEALGALGPRAAQAAPALVVLLKDPQAPVWVRHAVVEALGRIGPTVREAADAQSALAAALDDPDPWLRVHAVWALGECGPPDEVIGLIRSKLGDEDFEVRAAAAEALGLLGPDALPALRVVLRDPAADVRPMAVCALGRIGTAARDDLEAVREDPDPQVRAACVEAFAEIQERESRRHARMLGLLGPALLVLAGSILLIRRLRE